MLRKLKVATKEDWDRGNAAFKRHDIANVKNGGERVLDAAMVIIELEQQIKQLKRDQRETVKELVRMRGVAHAYKNSLQNVEKQKKTR